MAPQTRQSTALLLATLLLQPSTAQKVTAGPAATVSLAKDAAYSTARSCAVGCLVYNGIYHCGVHAGYQDLGIGLGCGCGPANGCFCSAKYASSATAYVSSCVSARCAANVADWADEAGSMLAMYGSYCATATVDVGGGNAPAPTGGSGTTTTTRGAGAAATTQKGAAGEVVPLETGASAATTDAGQGSKAGLSQSDIIALAASLGVGVPSLLIAAATLWVQMRKKKGKATAGAAGAGPEGAKPAEIGS